MFVVPSATVTRTVGTITVPSAGTTSAAVAPTFATEFARPNVMSWLVAAVPVSLAVENTSPTSKYSQ